MLSSIWREIILKMDRKYKALGKKIVLIVYNAAPHKFDEVPENIKIVFPPPNTTSLIQPCDPGIIRAFKAHYRRQLNRKHLHALESGMGSNEFNKSVSVLDA